MDITTQQTKLQAKLNEIQQNLKAPKNQRNNFGNYNYRSAEDILESVKPLLGDAVLTISDKIVNVGDRYYVEATVTLSMGEAFISTQAYARESLDKKGMDDSQITGATSSYARKYALNGLFCIDDTKDADSMDNTKHVTKAPVRTEPKETTVEEDDHNQAMLDKKIKTLYAVLRNAGFDNPSVKAKEIALEHGVMGIGSLHIADLNAEINKYSAMGS